MDTILYSAVWTESFNYLNGLILTIVSLNLWFIVGCGVKDRKLRRVNTMDGRENVESQNANSQVPLKAVSAENPFKAATDLPPCFSEPTGAKQLTASNERSIKQSIREDKTQAVYSPHARVSPHASVREDKTQDSSRKEPSTRSKRDKSRSRAYDANDNKIEFERSPKSHARSLQSSMREEKTQESPRSARSTHSNREKSRSKTHDGENSKRSKKRKNEDRLLEIRRNLKKKSSSSYASVNEKNKRPGLLESPRNSTRGKIKTTDDISSHFDTRSLPTKQKSKRSAHRTKSEGTKDSERHSSRSKRGKSRKTTDEKSSRREKSKFSLLSAPNNGGSSKRQKTKKETSSRHAKKSSSGKLLNSPSHASSSKRQKTKEEKSSHAKKISSGKLLNSPSHASSSKRAKSRKSRTTGD